MRIGGFRLFVSIVCGAIFIGKSVLADGAAGILHLSVPSNGEVAVSMPFEPFGDGLPGSFLAGSFIGDGGDGSDTLHHLLPLTGDMISYRFRQDGWVVQDATNGIAASLGDALLLSSGNGSVLDVFAYGRVPEEGNVSSVLRPGENLLSYGFPCLAFLRDDLPYGVTAPVDWNGECILDDHIPWWRAFVVTNVTDAPIVWNRPRPYPAIHAGYPFISGMSIGEDDDYVEISVSTDGNPTDIIAADSGVEGFGVNADWVHADRRAGGTLDFSWQDYAPLGAQPDGFSRFYLVSDATRDADGDGIADALERYVYGTSPELRDTDGDGVEDGLELAWGTDPLHAGPSNPAFVETFEPPDVMHGGVAGQNGWVASPATNAYVQETATYEGLGALKLAANDGDNLYGSVEAAHSVTCSANVVWMDVRQFAMRDSVMPQDAEDAIVFFMFDNGHPVMTDGDAFFTNSAFSVGLTGSWVRCTCMLDFVSRTWDFYIDGIIVGQGLAMRGSSTAVHDVSIQGGFGVTDNLTVSPVRPEGLSSDGDSLPDEWEFARFGMLGQNDASDFDGDGLSDRTEYDSGTDPIRGDTDGDGMPDGWEVENGLNPLDPSDATGDPDGDGVLNADEYAFGGNPNLNEPDPRIRRPGLRSEFWRTSGKQKTMPNFSRLMPSGVSVSPQVNHPVLPWFDDGTVLDTYFASRIEGFIRIPFDGRYTLSLTSNAGAALYIDGAVVLSDAVAHSSRTKNVTLDLSVGYHDIRIDYYKNKGSEVLALEWSAWGLEREIVPASAFCHIPEVPRYPAGYVPGVDVSYYAFTSALKKMPEVSGLIPSATSVVSKVFHPKAVTPWEGAPESLVDRFAAVFDGMMLVPSSGRYNFSLSSDDGARLWLDGKCVISHAYSAHRWATRKATVALAEGLHPFQVEYFQNVETSGVQLAWSRGGTQFETIPPRFLFRPSGEPIDSDGDGMPDWWEAKYSLDVDDPSDAGLDPDGDGLSNLEEFHAGTDPHQADTDGDGMPDLWEINHSMCPFYGRDAFEDDDGDGIPNLEESICGTDIWSPDTDGDGVSDGDERNVYFSDPTVADFDGGLTTNVVLDADLADVAHGRWYAVDGILFAAGRSGTVFFTNDLNVAQCGPQQIRMKTAFRGPYDAELVCRIDGEPVGVARLPSSSDVVTNDVSFLTRWMQIGVHVVSFEFQNFANDVEFQFWDVVVGVPIGPDANGNGVCDWIDSRMSNSCIERSGTVSSKVSPFCMRGRAVVPPKVDLADGSLAVRPLPQSGWWADVPLVANGATEASVTYEDGMKTDVVQIVWSPFDVMHEESVILRRGDSLLLSFGGGSGGDAIVVDGTAVAEPVTTAVPYAFNVCGDHVLTAVQGGVTNTVSVKVVGCELGDELPAWRGKVNTFRISGSGLGDMEIAADRGGEVVQAEVVDGEFLCSVSVPSYGRPSSLSFEIPNPDASVAGSVAIKPFSAYYTLEKTYYVFKILDDGTRVVENRLTAFDVPSSVLLKMTSASGVCFADGSGSISMTSGSFSGTGDYIYRFYVPEGVEHPCQFLRAYYNGKEIAQ